MVLARVLSFPRLVPVMSKFSLRSILSPPKSLAKTARSTPRGVLQSIFSTHALWCSAANLRRVVRRLVSRSAASRSTSNPTRSSNDRASSTHFPWNVSHDSTSG
jgi:hypothetical protein